jgi:hypothetical protein
VSEVREFLENLAMDQLIALAGEPGHELLRRLTLFRLPVPEAVAEQMGASLARRRDLGLVDRHEDVVDPHVPAVAANTLAIARVAPLDEDEKMVARKIVQELFAARGAAATKAARSSTCDLQLTGVGLLTEDAEIVSACDRRCQCRR